MGWVIAAGLLSQAVAPGALAQSASPTSSVSQKPAAAVGSEPSRAFTFEMIKGVVTPTQPLQLTLGIGAGKKLDDPKIQVSIYQRIHDRAELQEAVLNPDPKNGFSGFVQPLDPIAERESRTITLERSFTELLLDRLDSKGVYLVEITLKNNNERVSFLRTTMVVPPNTAPVPAAIVGVLGQTSQSVVVESKEDLPTQAQEIIPTPAYDADLLGLVDTGQADVAVRTVTEGLRDRQPPADQAPATGKTPTGVLAAPGPIDQRIATQLANLDDLAGLVVPAGSLSVNGAISKHHKLRIISGDNTVKTAANTLDGAALSQWMAAYAALPDYIEPPGQKNFSESASAEEKKRGRVKTQPEAPPSPVVLDLRAVSTSEDQQVLSQTLKTLPWVQVGKVADLVARPLADIPVASFEHPKVAPARKTYFERLAKARSVLPVLLAMTDKRSFEDGTNPQHFDQELLEATSVHTQDSQAADRVLNAFEQVTSGIQVLSPPPITMTGDEGTIPISVINDSGIALDVQVRVISSNLELEGPSVVPMRLRANDATTKNVVVAPRTSGGLTSALVQVENPKTGDIIATGAISVRSTAYPFTALLFAAGAIGILLLWGWKNRPNRLRAEPELAPQEPVDRADYQDEPLEHPDLPAEPSSESVAVMETTEPIERGKGDCQ